MRVYWGRWLILIAWDEGMVNYQSGGYKYWRVYLRRDFALIVDLQRHYKINRGWLVVYCFYLKLLLQNNFPNCCLEVFQHGFRGAVLPLVGTGFVQMSLPEERLNSSGKERRNFTNSLVVTVASYYSNTLKFSELFNNNSFFCKCLWRQTAWPGAWPYTPVAMTPVFKDEEVWPNTHVPVLCLFIFKLHIRIRQNSFWVAFSEECGLGRPFAWNIISITCPKTKLEILSSASNNNCSVCIQYRIVTDSLILEQS